MDEGEITCTECGIRCGMLKHTLRHRVAVDGGLGIGIQFDVSRSRTRDAYISGWLTGVVGDYPAAYVG